jgi:hypothetical protein
METNTLDYKITQYKGSYNVIGYTFFEKDGERHYFEKKVSIPDLTTLPDALAIIREEYASTSTRQSSTVN